MGRRLLSFGWIPAASALLSGCAAHSGAAWDAPIAVRPTPATDTLRSLPPAREKVAVAVYGFTDQTGQFKHSETGQTLSRAVTQGATSILVKSLHEAGQRGWFTVIEREKLDNVLRERAVIREMRASYLGEKVVNPSALPPLLFAGVLLEGGIIGYDSNTKTGGLGARFLGIGASTEFREDTVTVYLRAVSVKTGEVLASVSVRKTIAAIGAGANAFRYVAFKELLELETGFTYNEPDHLALQQAIEAAVHGLIMEGAMQDLWCIAATPDEGRKLLAEYLARRDGRRPEEVRLPLTRTGQPVSGTCNGNVAYQVPAGSVAAPPAPRTIGQTVASSRSGLQAAPKAPLPRAAQENAATSPARPRSTVPAAPLPATASTGPDTFQNPSSHRPPATMAKDSPLAARP